MEAFLEALMSPGVITAILTTLLGAGGIFGTAFAAFTKKLRVGNDNLMQTSNELSKVLNDSPTANNELLKLAVEKGLPWAEREIKKLLKK